jgi:phosphopantothenoylcysteine synthetase/decarboxylase
MAPGTMDDEELREHITLASNGDQFRLQGLTAEIVASCWPGGSQDRSDRTATEWLRRWRPEKVGAVLPACSCVNGHCAVCN